MLQPFVEVINHYVISVKRSNISDVDECQESNGGCSCEENIPREAGCFSRCNNTMGSFYCICTPGFVLEFDQLTCQGNRCNIRHSYQIHLIRS